MMMGTRQRLEDHIGECTRMNRQLRRQVRALSHQTESQFMGMRAERDRMHAENGAAIRELRAVVWKFGFAILGVLLGLAASQHI
jgi:hypothetical protein